MFTDFLDNEINIGDIVIVSRLKCVGFQKAEVTGFTNKMVKLKYIPGPDMYNRYVTNVTKFPSDIIVVTSIDNTKTEVL